jgi:hypothetical protein
VWDVVAPAGGRIHHIHPGKGGINRHRYLVRALVIPSSSKVGRRLSPTQKTHISAANLARFVGISLLHHVTFSWIMTGRDEDGDIVAVQTK